MARRLSRPVSMSVVASAWACTRVWRNSSAWRLMRTRMALIHMATTASAISDTAETVKCVRPRCHEKPGAPDQTSPNWARLTHKAAQPPRSRHWRGLRRNMATATAWASRMMVSPRYSPIST